MQVQVSMVQGYETAASAKGRDAGVQVQMSMGAALAYWPNAELCRVAEALAQSERLLNTFQLSRNESSKGCRYLFSSAGSQRGVWLRARA